MAVDSIEFSENTLFLRILDKIIEFGGEGATMATLAQTLGVREQNVYYHIPKLVSTGMIYKEDTRYYPQPILANIGLQEYISDAISDIITYIISDSNCSVFIEGASEDETSDVMENCIKTLIFRELV